MNNLIREQCAKSLPRFMERAASVPWQQRSILLSEAFAFCVIADLFDVDIILESGIYLGRSTEIWANYFPDKQVCAVDQRLKEKVKERLQGYDNITLIEEDGLHSLNLLIEKFRNKKIGIFMDGPKGKFAIDWGKEALSQQGVKFFALHDISKSKKAIREYFISLNKENFFTDEEWFIDEYSKMDKNESNWDKRQGLIWIPFKLIFEDRKRDKILGSYGPTIGFAFKQGNSEMKYKIMD